MRSAIGVVREQGGTCRTRDLRAAGLEARSIASAVASGRIERARIGHFVAPDLPDTVKRAIRVGGRLTCVSAAQAMGLRVLSEPTCLHVEVAEHDSRFRRPGDPTTRLRPKLQRLTEHRQVHFHWRGVRHSDGVMPPLLDVLVAVIGCLPALDALCIVDSARERMPTAWMPPALNDAEFTQMLDRLPPDQRALALRSSSLSQAVGETIARERFRQAGIHAQPQVELPGGFRADLLIGDRLIFECEGLDAHSSPDAFHADRERMAWLRACGYLVLNFSHTQIVEDWPSVLSTVLLVMRRGAHLAA
jgi:very-short-patch-repair endonuclease